MYYRQDLKTEQSVDGKTQDAIDDTLVTLGGIFDISSNI